MANKNIEREGPLVDEFLRHDLLFRWLMSSGVSTYWYEVKKFLP